MKQADVVSEFEREVHEWQKIDPHVRPEVDGRVCSQLRRHGVATSCRSEG
jgi:hypothetical protein